MRLNYRKMGEGKPLFILHGLFGLSDNWATIGKILSQHFEVYLIDLRNHGHSPHSDEWTYPAMANDILELIENVLKDKQPNDEQSNKNSSAILMGHSLGGKVAMQFASLYPEKLEKLIVVDMAPKNYSGSSFDFAQKLIAINLPELKTRKEAEEKLSSFIHTTAELQWMQKNIYWRPHPQSPCLTPLKERGKRRGEKLEGSNNQILEWKFNLKAIAENSNKIKNTFNLGKKQISAPALFIRGEKSNYILDSDISEIKKIFSNSEFITIAGAGHWVHADNPKEFAEAVKIFLI